MQLVWKKYREIFPDRYLKENLLDARVKDLLEKHPRKRRCLDVGGGLLGTTALNHPDNKVWGLDTHVHPPDWQKPISWEEVHKNLGEYHFDLIVARGSIAYLAKSQIRLLADVLCFHGILIFNTFLQPTEFTREFTNSTSETKGTETTKFLADKGKIQHTLTLPNPKGEPKQIQHEFHFHPEGTLRSLLKHGTLEVTRHKTNSALFEFHKN